MEGLMEQFQHLKIQWEEITSATNSFDHNNFVGGGGFGSVYKGALARFKDRSMVAFKRLDRKHGQGDAEFLKEITFLSRYTHENLISLLGYCIQEKEMILVYEYASRGSLDHHLNSTDLSWTQRLKICLAAAKGLNYLHDPRETSQRLIHCDVKSANILLDDKWNAKVADFGLSKVAPANQHNSVLLTNALGTVGYCDPLFMETYSLTKESDVYSFGVVLFEVLCGRLCSQKGNDGQIHVLVPMWKKSYEENKLHEIIFPDLMQKMDPMSLKIFSETAFLCLEKHREERPKMSFVMEKLGIALQCQEYVELQVDDDDELDEKKKYEEIVKSAEPLFSTPPYTNSNCFSPKGPISTGARRQHCELISIEECIVPDKGVSYFYNADYNSRFLVGTLFALSCEFRVHVRAQFLTPLITYTVNLVFKFKDEMELQPKQANINLKYKFKGQSKGFTSYFADKRKDDWWMVELCHFTSEQGTTTADLQITFQGNNPWIVVEGIEFLPVQELEKAERHLEETQPISSDLDTNREQELPIDYEDIIKMAKDSVPMNTTKKELCLILSNGFLLKNGQEWLSLDKNAKKSLMLSPRAAIDVDEIDITWQSFPGSRFGEALDVKYWVESFNIVSKIKSQLLESETTYATYLVYKLPESDQPKFESWMKVMDNKDSGSDDDDWEEPDYLYVLLVSPQTPFIGASGKVDQNTHNAWNRPDLKGIPKERGDGWMEVKVWEFQTPTPTTAEIIPISLKFISDGYLNGLIIQGIDFRPIL